MRQKGRVRSTWEKSEGKASQKWWMELSPEGRVAVFKLTREERGQIFQLEAMLYMKTQVRLRRG